MTNPPSTIMLPSGAPPCILLVWRTPRTRLHLRTPSMASPFAAMQDYQYWGKVARLPSSSGRRSSGSVSPATSLLGRASMPTSRLPIARCPSSDVTLVTLARCLGCGGPEGECPVRTHCDQGSLGLLRDTCSPTPPVVSTGGGVCPEAQFLSAALGRTTRRAASRVAGCTSPLRDLW